MNQTRDNQPSTSLFITSVAMIPPNLPDDVFARVSVLLETYPYVIVQNFVRPIVQSDGDALNAYLVEVLNKYPLKALGDLKVSNLGVEDEEKVVEIDGPEPGEDDPTYHQLFKTLIASMAARGIKPSTDLTKLYMALTYQEFMEACNRAQSCRQ